MNKSQDKIVELSFPLEIKDDWPPVAVENIQFKLLSNGYQLLSPPLFIKDLSVGDIIDIKTDDRGLIKEWHHILRSRNSTIWLLRILNNEQIEAALDKLRSLGCNTASFRSVGTYAIEIPEDLHISEVDEVISQLDENSTAVAYPSFRHDE